jgi:Pregnancy-associated plasma protein-A
MKKYLFLIASLLLLHAAIAQKSDCGTRTPAIPLLVNPAWESQLRIQYTSPLLMKVFVRVIANDDGTLRAAQDTSVMKQLENMRQFYAAHDICFILAGIEQLNSTDLNTHNADTEEGDLAAFLIPGLLNIFIHRTLFDDKGSLNGIAYGIPNYYLSVVSSAINETGNNVGNRSTTAHEMGHCFGLLHTFETNYGVENIRRSAPCVNCFSAGDLLCDTEADPHSDTYNTANEITNCVFSDPSTTQNCNGSQLQYRMNPRNVMAYGERTCRDLFTDGQGGRARSFINNTLILQQCIAPDTDNVTASQTIGSGREFIIARNAVTINANSFIVNNSARVNISCNNEVVIKPGATFSPTTTNAYVNVIASRLCY